MVFAEHHFSHGFCLYNSYGLKGLLVIARELQNNIRIDVALSHVPWCYAVSAALLSVGVRLHASGTKKLDSDAVLRGRLRDPHFQ